MPKTPLRSGDAAVVDNLANWFESFGLEVEKQELHLYLATPVSAAVSIIDPAGGAPIPAGAVPLPPPKDQ